MSPALQEHTEGNSVNIQYVPLAALYGKTTAQNITAPTRKVFGKKVSTAAKDKAETFSTTDKFSFTVKGDKGSEKIRSGSNVKGEKKE